MSTRRVVMFARLLLCAACVACGAGSARGAGDGVDGVMAAEAMLSTPRLRGIAAEAARYRVQVLVGEIEEDAFGRATLRRHAFRADAEYFYPASSVKVFAAAAAAVRVRELGSTLDARIGPDTPLVFHPLFEGETLEREDATNPRGGTITVRNEVRKTLIVSDNEAYNKLYELCGRDVLNRVVRAAGLASVRIDHRLAEGRTHEENGRSPRIDFVVGDSVVTLPERFAGGSVDTAYSEGLPGWPTIGLGRAYASGGGVVEGPFPMGHRNTASLRDLQNVLAMIVRPDVDLGLPGLPLHAEDRAMLVAALSDAPSASESPRFDPAEFSDDDPHFFLPGLERVVPRSDLFVAKKVGLAYGFSTETAYVEHRPSGRAFFLAMTLYTNDNAVLNDGVYEYELAHAAMADVAEAVARRVLGSVADGRGLTAAPSPFLHAEHALHAGAGLSLAVGTAWTGRVVPVGVGAVEAVASWNAAASDGGGARVEARVADGGGAWSAWMSLGEIGAVSVEPWVTDDAGSSVDVDTLMLVPGATAVQFRVRATGPTGAVTLDRFDACVTRAARGPRLVEDDRLAGRVGVAPPFSPHGVTDAALASRLCSPLSLRMLLAQRGVERDAASLAAAVLDERHGIYGNWSSAIAAAGRTGVPGRLTRFSDWASVRRHLSRVGPLAVSLRFSAEEMPAAGYDAGEGHLLVLYGLDDRGDALVQDPAYGTEPEARRTYPREAMSLAWLERAKGLAYALEARPSEERGRE